MATVLRLLGDIHFYKLELDNLEQNANKAALLAMVQNQPSACGESHCEETQ